MARAETEKHGTLTHVRCMSTVNVGTLETRGIGRWTMDIDVWIDWYYAEYKHMPPYWLYQRIIRQNGIKLEVSVVDEEFWLMVEAPKGLI